MHENIKLALRQLTQKDLQNLSEINDLQISYEDLVILYYLLTTHWDQFMDDTSLTLKETALTPYATPETILKYREIITLIKRNIIFKGKL